VPDAESPGSFLRDTTLRDNFRKRVKLFKKRAQRPPARLAMLTAIGVGNAIEWYDWNIYATFSAFFAAQFFTSGDASSELLSTLAVFAVGFVARPFGGMLFGWLADRTGRQPAMTLSVVTAAAGSLIIGGTPSAATIGIAAPIVLLVARLVQGLAQGGELPAAQTYLAEVAPPARRGLWSSLIYVSGSLGTLLGTALGALLTAVLSAGDMRSFGWRIPFLLGGVLGLFAAVMRRRMTETAVFRRNRASAPSTSLRRQFIGNPKALLRVIGFTAGGTVVYYAWAVATAPVAIQQRGTDSAGAFWAASGATVLYIVVLPFWGALSDRVGRKPILLGSTVLSAVLFFPLQALIQGRTWQLFVAMGIALLLIAGTSAIGPAYFAELFPTGIRAIGLGVPYSLTVALFGGTAPYLQTYLEQQHNGAAFSGWVIALLAISAVTIALTPETRDRDLTADESVRRSAHDCASNDRFDPTRAEVRWDGHCER
jgi:MFS transporter, MHS family, alpha-ketoglutarate permease